MHGTFHNMASLILADDLALGDHDVRVSRGDSVISTYDYVRLLSLSGMNLAAQDLYKYFTYIAIVDVVGCEFIGVFAAWFLLSQLLSFGWNVVSSVIVDTVGDRQDVVMKIGSLLQFLCVVLMVAAVDGRWGVPRNLVFMNVAYQSFQAVYAVTGSRYGTRERCYRVHVTVSYAYRYLRYTKQLSNSFQYCKI